MEGSLVDPPGMGNVVIHQSGVLETGSAARPIPPGVLAEIRRVLPRGAAFVGGGDFVPGDVGICVFDGGRWKLCGG